MARITALNVYPVKSCRGIALDAAQLAETGLAHDREWMVVDGRGEFCSQRTLPKMALIGSALSADALTLSAQGAGEISIPFDFTGAPAQGTVWGQRCEAFDQGDGAAGWLSSFLERPVRLLRFNREFTRLSSEDYTGQLKAKNQFSDGFPLLLVSEASLDELNSRLDEPLPMNRFRPNIVVDGIEAFEEDFIESFRADGIALKPVKACTRCAITTTDQATAERGLEPLQTLAGFRYDSKLEGVTFGQNVVIESGVGQALRVGQSLKVNWSF